MKKMTSLFSLTGLALLLAATGCSKAESETATPPPKPVAATIQGTWQGLATAEATGGSPTLILVGNTLEFHGADTNEWYKGTFTLNESTNPKQMIVVITDCPAPQYIGKTGNAIYQLENGTLTIAGNEPGKPTMPSGFDDPEARKLVFKAK